MSIISKQKTSNTTFPIRKGRKELIVNQSTRAANNKIVNKIFKLACKWLQLIIEKKKKWIVLKSDPTTCWLQETHTTREDSHELRVKICKSTWQANGRDKEVGTANLISDKVDFMLKSVRADNDGHCILKKWKIHNEDLATVNIFHRILYPWLHNSNTKSHKVHIDFAQSNSRKLQYPTLKNISTETSEHIRDT